MTELSKEILAIERKMVELNNEREELRSKAAELGYRPPGNEERMEEIEINIETFKKDWQAEKMSLYCYVNGLGNIECKRSS